MSINILFVDDEIEFLSTMSKRLTKRNFTVFTANSAKEAVEVLKIHSTIDVVVLDFKMPDIDGIEALKLIKKTSPLVEVIILTGHATIESAIDGMKLGAFDYLMKIVDIEDLIVKVTLAKNKKLAHEQSIMEASKKGTHTKLRSEVE